jgi:exosome complex RNA-binding protein Csl4
MRSLVARTTIAAVLGVAASLVSAHHSFAMFDQTKQVTVIGKVTDVQWTNPHVWIFLDGAPAGGKKERWGVEFTSKVHLTRRNFTSDMVKVGDNVEFTVNPYRDGKTGGRFVAVKMASGEYYCDVGQAAQVFCQGDKK